MRHVGEKVNQVFNTLNVGDLHRLEGFTGIIITLIEAPALLQDIVRINILKNFL
jgi:acetamidase/formamidase